MGGALRLIARHGRLALVVGLLAGLLLPGLAQALRPAIPYLIACLLSVTAGRIGWRAVIGSLPDLRTTSRIILIYQVVLPALVLMPALLLGITGHAIVLAIILLLAAPSVTGAPNFAILVEQDPAPALRLLILGTAVFPVTVLPFLWVMPEFSDPLRLVGASARFFLLIGTAAVIGFLLHEWLGPPQARGLKTLDGLAAVLLAVVVVGLMSAIGPAMRSEPLALLGWALAAIGINLGLQTAAALWLGPAPETPARAIVAGNRNIALMLLALPPETTTELLIFIGCYQIPMYLTPIVMRRFYAGLA
jgi:hypothetical protein